jgi:hypothetical protein
MYRFYRKHYARKTPPLIRMLIIPGLALRASGQIARYQWRNISGQHRSGRRRRR